MPGLKGWFVLVFLFVLAACAGPDEASPPMGSSMGIANPASVHCAKVGGQLEIRKNPAGAEYGVCLFEGNRECEEWALFRGECPVGGVLTPHPE